MIAVSHIVFNRLACSSSWCLYWLVNKKKRKRKSNSETKKKKFLSIHCYQTRHINSFNDSSLIKTKKLDLMWLKYNESQWTLVGDNNTDPVNKDNKIYLSLSLLSLYIYIRKIYTIYRYLILNWIDHYSIWLSCVCVTTHTL